MAEAAEVKRGVGEAAVESRDVDEFAAVLKQSFQPRT